jgi:hypothetical protein
VRVSIVNPRMPCKWFIGVDFFPGGQLDCASAIVTVGEKRFLAVEEPYYILCNTLVLDVKDFVTMIARSGQARIPCDHIPRGI